MRYNLKDRIARPFPEDSHLWAALDFLRVEYEKMAETRHFQDKRYNGYIVPAKVQLNNKGDWGAIMYKERYYIRAGKTYGISNKTRDLLKARDEWIRSQCIPYLKVKRTWTSGEMRLVIENWINKEKRKLEGGV